MPVTEIATHRIIADRFDDPAFDENLTLAQYATWVRRYDDASLDSACEISTFLESVANLPAVLVVRLAVAVPEEGAAGGPRLIYPRYAVTTVADDGLGLCAALEQVVVESAAALIVLIPHEAVLHPSAVAEFALAALASPEAEIFFADQDVIEGGQRRSPWFKTAFDPVLALGRDPVGFPVAYRRDVLLRACHRTSVKGSVDLFLYELVLVLLASGRADHFLHIPRVLGHRTAAGDWNGDGARRLLSQHLQLAPARIARHRSNPDWTHVSWAVPDPLPLVSVIVPTKDQPARLKQTIDGLLHQTRYCALEIILVDNGTTDASALAYLQSVARNERVRVLRDERPFNYAALNNAAARQACGEVLVLLNNDMGMLDALWLERLVAALHHPGVGLVGAKLFYEDRRIQHAGVVFGRDGAISHQLRLAECDDLGPQGELALSRCVSAVTGACQAMRLDDFRRVGGMNEDFAVAFNDIDLCRRIAALGLLVVFAADVELIHCESVSRGQGSLTARAREYREHTQFWRLHADLYENGDPYHNANLIFAHHGTFLACPPGRQTPWQSRVEEQAYLRPLLR